MNTKAYITETWTADDLITVNRQTLDLQVKSLTAIARSKPTLTDLADMSEFERARHTSKTWSMGQD
jgi:hypothetical protein